jgi:type IV secretory pathway VirB10-like protein
MMMSRLAGIAGLVSLSLIACGGTEEKPADAKQPVTAAAPNNTTKDDPDAKEDPAPAAGATTDPGAQTNTPPAGTDETPAEGEEAEPTDEEAPEAATCKFELKDGTRVEKDDVSEQSCQMICLGNGSDSCEWNGQPVDLEGDIDEPPQPGGGRCEGELSNGATFWTEGGSKSQCVSQCEKKQKANTKVTVTCTYDGENVFGG